MMLNPYEPQERTPEEVKISRSLIARIKAEQKRLEGQAVAKVRSERKEKLETVRGHQ